MSTVSYQELDSLACELLPPRVLLSLIDVTFDGRSYSPPQSESGSGGGQVAYACQTTTTQGTPGLVGALGLGQNPSSTMSCVPAGTTVYH